MTNSDRIQGIDDLQERLWLRYRPHQRSIFEALSTIHKNISCGVGVLPYGVTPDRGEKRAFFEYISDAVAEAMLLLSRHQHKMGAFSEEVDWHTETLHETANYLHRQISGAYTQVADAHPDDLFWWCIANFVYQALQFSKMMRVGLLKIVEKRWLRK